jgi:hypothetical protein
VRPTATNAQTWRRNGLISYSVFLLITRKLPIWTHTFSEHNQECVGTPHISTILAAIMHHIAKSSQRDLMTTEFKFKLGYNMWHLCYRI